MPIKRAGSGAPLFCMHGEPVRLARILDSDRPVYALNYVYQTDAYETAPADMPGLARLYVAEIQKVQPIGPYYLFGFSAGATVAYEMALQLLEQGERIGHLCLVEPVLTPRSTISQMGDVVRGVSGEVSLWNRTAAFMRLLAIGIQRRARVLRDLVRTRWHRAVGTVMPMRLRWVNFLAHIRPAANSYWYAPLHCPADVVYRNLRPEAVTNLTAFWSETIGSPVGVYSLDGAVEHLDLMTEESLRLVARLLNERLEQEGNAGL